MNIVNSSQANPDEVRRLANPPHLSFEHLDWISPRERLFSDATFAFQQDGILTALLCVSPENERFAWLRFFYSLRDGQHERYFQGLITHSLSWLSQQNVKKVFCLASSSWLETLLKNEDFAPGSQIINLSRDNEQLPELKISEDWFSREMTYADLDKVYELDQQCFAEPWQLSRESLIKCYFSSARSSLVIQSGKIVAYQVSTRLFDQVHIARLAVLPDYRRMGLGSALISDVFNYFKDTGEITYSVNTQADNFNSHQLYQKNGFTIDEQKIPVYTRLTAG